MILLLLTLTAFADELPSKYICNGDMFQQFLDAEKPADQECILIPIENGNYKDLSDYKVEGGQFVIDQAKVDARLQAEAEAKESEAVKRLGTIPNYKCNGDMNVTYAIKPANADCIQIPTKDGKHIDLSDKKIQNGKFVDDDIKKAARLAAKQAEENAKQAKKNERKAIKQLGRKATLVNADRDELIKYLVKELISDEE